MDEFGKLVHTIKSRHIGFIRLPVTVSNRLSKCSLSSGEERGLFPEQRLEIEPNRGQWMV